MLCVDNKLVRQSHTVNELMSSYLVQTQTKEAGDLVVTFTVDTAEPEDVLAALRGMLGSDGQLTAALQSRAGVTLVPESLRQVPPASDA